LSPAIVNLSASANAGEAISVRHPRWEPSIETLGEFGEPLG
jgi:hypothetical protein